MQLVDDQILHAAWEASYVNTPKERTPEGKERDPNTSDTARQWHSHHHPKPGRYLVVGSQPYVHRQVFDVMGAVPTDEGYTFVGTGYPAPATMPLKSFLDEAPRRLQMELKFRQRQ